ncbi:flagellar biosynthesis protein FliQ [Catenovulum adriaticum]|uniref:Flagellar biosynthetic protein FliQ n=1 Tax=Catenovulum adriaticum TaxID=2984846 RepID=A0ABY7AIN1_9ALTE|nr:flagellar biosynthesis protein FliQ [Catenovulum sp. TS8]WAJ69309.1 flagellar biosynthesis protein FliQ [Catenovulum sp. TS8]
MQPEIFVDILQEAMFMVILLVCLVIVPSMIVGLIVAIFQAATSINEQTLSFLPRLIVTLAAIVYGGHWGINHLMEYTIGMFMRVQQVVG